MFSALKTQVPQEAKDKFAVYQKPCFQGKKKENTYTPKRFQGVRGAPLRAVLVYRFWPPIFNSIRGPSLSSLVRHVTRHFAATHPPPLGSKRCSATRLEPPNHHKTNALDSVTSFHYGGNCLLLQTHMGAHLRGRTATQRSKKGSEKVLGRVLGKGSLKGSEKGVCWVLQ